MTFRQGFMLILGVIAITYVHAQPEQLVSSADSSKLSPQILSKYLTEVVSKTDLLQGKLGKKANNALLRMQKEELKLKKKLAKKDSLAAERLFSGTEEKYNSLQTKLATKTQSANNSSLNYNQYLDTLKTSLQFLKSNTENISGLSGGMKEKLENAISKANALDFKMNQAQAIQQFLKERRQYLKEQLSKFGLAGHMKKMNKEVFYYSQAIKEYKNILKDRKKIESKALALLRKTPVFKKFMQRHSQLASIFGSPADNPGPVSFAGVQTRASVQQLIQNSIPAGVANPQQFITQQLQSVNQQASGRRNAIRIPEWQDNLGEMPDFKPNQQRSKPFLKRLEFGSSIQFGKVNRFLPSTSDLAISVGYKLNDNGVIGIGSSYKLGLGKSIRQIRFTRQGYGFRSFIDWKIKRSIYVSGGYEKNYLPRLEDAVAAAGAPLSVHQQAELWQESGLIGISKKYAMSKKRKGYVQVLFDFLSYKNIPRSQPVIFRTGINF